MSVVTQPFSYPVDLASHVTTAWVYDRTVWTANAEYINLAALPTPGTPQRLQTPYFLNAAPPRDLLAAFRANTITWEDFQTWYTAHLANFLRWDSLELVVEILTRAPTVIILWSERPGAQGEADVRCARRIFRTWLLGEVLA